MEAKADVVRLLCSSGHRLPREATPAPPPAALSLDLMHPAIQAEIARQVALAMQREREARFVAATPPTKGSRIRFPDAG
jgi:hypothetical protein